MATARRGDDDAACLARVQDIVYATPFRVPDQRPTQLLDHLWIGNYANADNIGLLRRLGITHVLNCAGMRVRTRGGNPYPRESGVVEYEQFTAEDSEAYNMMQHFPAARVFIERARRQGGKVLVHCHMGVNRSGAMCAAYLMVHEHMGLIDAVTKLKRLRAVVLCNPAFQRQLLKFSKQTGLFRFDRIAIGKR